MLVQKVLIPLDGSPLAERITVHAGRLLHAKSASALLLRVVRSAFEAEPAWKELEGLRDRLQASGVDASARVVVGEPAQRIIEIVREVDATLIALSTHGRSGVARVLRGSVAAEVLRRSPVPVLLANPFSLREAENLPIRRILVPLDGSARSAAILPAVSELARLHGSEVVLMNVVDLSWAHYPTAARPHELALAKDYLARELDRLDVRARPLIVEGKAAEEILAAVAREQIDLVALTTHGRSGTARWYFGSVAESVSRACPCPLLVARSTDAAAPREPDASGASVEAEASAEIHAHGPGTATAL
jgi:nucleotide-binding universal stress UspA family protein